MFHTISFTLQGSHLRSFNLYNKFKRFSLYGTNESFYGKKRVAKLITNFDYGIYSLFFFHGQNHIKVIGFFIVTKVAWNYHLLEQMVIGYRIYEIRRTNERESFVSCFLNYVDIIRSTSYWNCSRRNNRSEPFCTNLQPVG